MMPATKKSVNHIIISEQIRKTFQILENLDVCICILD